jgi:hypothetical protein
MSPHHFANMYGRRQRQSQKEIEFEAKVEHAIQFAFSPAVFHPIKTVNKLRRFLGRGSQSKQ